MQKKLLLKILKGILTGLCAAALIGCGTKSLEGNAVVMEIDGQKVVKEEYQMVVQDYAAIVKSGYSTEEVNKADFWKKKAEDASKESPLSQVIRLAMEELTHKKVIAKMALEAGIDAKTDYLALQEQLERENDRKGEAETITYGLTSYGIEEYYEYCYTGIEAELLERLKAKQEVTEDDLFTVYQKETERYMSDVRLEALVGEMYFDVGEQLAKEAVKAMQSGADAKALSTSFPKINFYALTMSSLDTKAGKSGAYELRWEAAQKLKEKEVSEVFQIGEHLMIIRCEKREENVAEPFSEIKDVLESEVRTQMAKKEIRAREMGADIRFLQENLEQAAMEVLEGN